MFFRQSRNIGTGRNVALFDHCKFRDCFEITFENTFKIVSKHFMEIRKYACVRMWFALVPGLIKWTRKSRKLYRFCIFCLADIPPTFDQSCLCSVGLVYTRLSCSVNSCSRVVATVKKYIFASIDTPKIANIRLGTSNKRCQQLSSNQQSRVTTFIWSTVATVA